MSAATTVAARDSQRIFRTEVPGFSHECPPEPAHEQRLH